MATSFHPKPLEESADTEVTQVMVRAQLERILTSITFRRSTRLRDLLEFAVEAAFQGGITERQAALHLIDPDQTFDPAIDPTVRVQYSRLRRKLEDYYQGEGRNDGIVIRVPERSYTPVFELRTTALVQEDGKPTAVPDRQRSKPSVAVLPFVNLTNDPDNDAFCAGLTDEVISVLASAETVDVAARGSAFQFEGEAVDVRAVGKELGVDMILEGTVKLDGEQTRVTAQLANVDDGFTIWANSFEPPAATPSQPDLAAQIAEALPL